MIISCPRGDLNSGHTQGTGHHQRASHLAFDLPPRPAIPALRAPGYTRNLRRQHHRKHHRPLQGRAAACARNAAPALDPTPAQTEDRTMTTIAHTAVQPAGRPGRPGTVYLLHLLRPYVPYLGAPPCAF